MQGEKDVKDKEMLELKRDLYLKQKMEKEKQAQTVTEQEKETLRFEVKLNPEDFWRFMMHHSMGGMKGYFNIIFTAASVFLLLTRWSVLTTGYRLLLVICALIFTVWQPFLFWRKAVKQAKSPAMKEPMYLTFGEHGLLVEQGEQHAEFAWDLMARLDRTSNMFILYMDQMHAYLLPKAVLGEREEAFCKMAKTYLKPEQMKKV
ncbi:MAG: YcxB family protein [Brotaphodocola sp.]